MPMMLRKKDFYAGLLMVLLGAGIGVNSATYSLGTFAHVGPGMFPLMLGLMMVLVGALIFVTGLATPLEEGERVLPAAMEWRGWACILAGPLMFVLFGLYFGMAAATFMCVFVSALGDRTATLKGSAVLAAVVAVVGCLLFPTCSRFLSRCTVGGFRCSRARFPISGTASVSVSSRRISCGVLSASS
ncbi:tripartite tricarboxylate transporter TctB family protein [Bradyrhizobium sp. 30]|uniref:tripartite tricarboxylate transporter TctB family protein n=1 Tax=Bradyrhizobium sp. 30 TaxID=2782669 RepID=UPI001FF77D45|nr:tripartite tricarboxylate transporter TctB family protein [Bradyrhizobium sp. 30]